MADQSLSMVFGSRFSFKSVRAAELSGLLIWAGLQRSDRVGGLVFSDEGHQAFKPSRHPRQALRLLECINRFNNALQLPPSGPPSFNLNDALIELRRIARPGSQCFLISDWRQFDQVSSRLLFELNRHCQLLLFQVFDPLEAHLPPGRFKLSNGERELQLNTGDKQLETRFINAYTTWQQGITNQLAQMGIGCASVSTYQQPVDQLKSLQFGAAAGLAETSTQGFTGQSAGLAS